MRRFPEKSEGFTRLEKNLADCSGIQERGYEQVGYSHWFKAFRDMPGQLIANPAAKTPIDEQEIAAAVKTCLALVTFLRAVRANPGAPCSELPALIAPQFPDPITRALSALVPLANLQAVGLAQIQSPPLPTVEQVLDALEHYLRNNPRHFWECPQAGAATFEPIFDCYESVDWMLLERRPIAVPSEIANDDAVLVLADLLWNFRHLATETCPSQADDPGSTTPTRSLPQAARGAGRRRRPRTISIPVAPGGSSVDYIHRPRANLKREFECLADEAKRGNLPFTITFEEFEAYVRGALAKRQKPASPRPHRSRRKDQSDGQ